MSPWKVSPRASSPTSTPAWSRLFMRAATLCGGEGDVRGRVSVRVRLRVNRELGLEAYG